MACRISLFGFVTVSDRQSMTKEDIIEGVVSTIFLLLINKTSPQSKKVAGKRKRYPKECENARVFCFGLVSISSSRSQKNSHTNSPRQRKKKKESRMATPTTGGGGGGGEQQKQHTPQHKQTVLDLGKYIDKGVRVKLSEEEVKHFKKFDQLLNLVLDETKKYLRDVDDPLRITDETRKLGLIVTRGTSVMVVAVRWVGKEIEPIRSGRKCWCRKTIIKIMLRCMYICVEEDNVDFCASPFLSVLFPSFRDSLVYHHVVFVEQVCLPTQY